MSSDFEEDINDSQDLWNKKNEDLDVLKNSLDVLKKSLDGLKKENVDNVEYDLVVLTEQSIAGLEVFIAERSKILDGHKECLEGSRKCLMGIKASKKPHE